VCLIELSELRVPRFTNDTSGIMVICWLSSFPLSAPGGHKRASVAVCSFLGTCCSMKL
jgi:hypothetical protein